MKILGFAASNSKASINKQLVTHACQVAKEEVNSDIDIDILDLNDFEMPIYSIDREQENGVHPLANTFYEKLGNADRLMISYAEHNGSYSAAYKNIFDWCSRIDGKVFQDKPMLVFSASPGPGGASSVLKMANESAGFFGAQIRGSLSVPRFSENFDTSKGSLTNAELAASLRELIQALVAE